MWYCCKTCSKKHTKKTFFGNTIFEIVIRFLNTQFVAHKFLSNKFKKIIQIVIPSILGTFQKNT